jgi:mannose-6-phosphate isomerase-like protein (cupin superfamily)
VFKEALMDTLIDTIAEPTARTDYKRLGVRRDDVAPDGSDVRVLLRLEGGSMAHFELAPGQTSTAVVSGEYEEIWFFLTGRGAMWRRREGEESTVPVEPGVCITIPVGTEFQFRSFGYTPLAAVAITMPPWHGAGGGSTVRGKWEPTVP